MSPRLVDRTYRLKEAAAQLGIHEHSLTRAEREGRVPPAKRDELGHRLYDDGDIDRLRSLIRPR